MSKSFLVTLALVPLLVLGGANPRQGTWPPAEVRLTQAVPDFDFDRLNIRDAIRKLMKLNTTVSYSISPDVHGVVSGHLSGLDLDHALRMILSQVEASYRVESGILIFDKQEIDYDSFGSFYAEQAIEPSVALAESKYLYVVRGKWISKVSRINYSVLASTNLFDPHDEAQLMAPRGKAFDPLRVLSKIDFDKVEVRQVLHVLFDGANGMYRVAPDVKGLVTLHLRDVTVRQAIATAAAQVGATVTRKNRIRMVETAKIKFVSSDLRNYYRVNPDPPLPVPTINSDGPNLDITIGAMLMKVRKSDLRVIARAELP